MVDDDRLLTPLNRSPHCSLDTFLRGAQVQMSHDLGVYMHIHVPALPLADGE
jgi:hypothetical protein